MITLRGAKERHHVRSRKREGWLTFGPKGGSDPFGDGFGALFELDETRLSPGAVVASHSRPEAEIITYVLKGALAQEDSTGRSGIIRTGEFQHMTTGLRVRHSERNASAADGAHVFRMSLRPSEPELVCAYEQQFFPVAQRRGVLCIVASPDGRKGSLRLHQDALIYSVILDVGQHLIHALPQGRMAWLHVVHGDAILHGVALATGDGVGITSEPAVSFTARAETEETEVLLFDLVRPPQISGNGGAR